MMKYILLIIILFMLGDIESKISALNESEEEKVAKKKRKISLEQYKGKNICISLDNDDISDSYQFSPGSAIPGEIVDFDNEWFLFRYKEKNKIISRYFRIKDIEEIDEVKDR